MRNFVTTFDYVQNTMTFTVNTYAPTGTSIVSGGSSNSTGLSAAAVVGGLSVVLVIIGCVIGIVMFRKKSQKDALEKRVWQETGQQPS